MAFITCSFFSNVLQKSTQFNAIIPEGREIGAPVLYLLHGLKDDFTSWSRFTSIERYANEAGIAVIMPDAARSFYRDMAYGGAYYSFFTNELFPYVSRLFSFSTDKEKTYIAGVSMGGYGALKIALLNPSVFGAAACLSGAVDISNRLSRDPRWAEIRKLVFGDQIDVTNSNDDLFHIIKEPFSSPSPRLYITCGQDDFLFQNNLSFVNALSETSISFQFDPTPGVHDWKFWDAQIQKAIKFFFDTK